MNTRLSLSPAGWCATSRPPILAPCLPQPSLSLPSHVSVATVNKLRTAVLVNAARSVSSIQQAERWRNGIREKLGQPDLQNVEDISRTMTPKTLAGYLAGLRDREEIDQARLLQLYGFEAEPGTNQDSTRESGTLSFSWSAAVAASQKAVKRGPQSVTTKLKETFPDALQSQELSRPDLLAHQVEFLLLEMKSQNNTTTTSGPKHQAASAKQQEHIRNSITEKLGQPDFQNVEDMFSTQIVSPLKLAGCLVDLQEQGLIDHARLVQLCGFEAEPGTNQDSTSEGETPFSWSAALAAGQITSRKSRRGPKSVTTNLKKTFPDALQKQELSRPGLLVYQVQLLLLAMKSQDGSTSTSTSTSTSGSKTGTTKKGTATSLPGKTSSSTEVAASSTKGHESELADAESKSTDAELEPTDAESRPADAESKSTEAESRPADTKPPSKKKKKKGELSDVGIELLQLITDNEKGQVDKIGLLFGPAATTGLTSAELAWELLDMLDSAHLDLATLCGLYGIQLSTNDGTPISTVGGTSSSTVEGNSTQNGQGHSISHQTPLVPPTNLAASATASAPASRPSVPSSNAPQLLWALGLKEALQAEQQVALEQAFQASRAPLASFIISSPFTIPSAAADSLVVHVEDRLRLQFPAEVEAQELHRPGLTLLQSEMLVQHVLREKKCISPKDLIRCQEYANGKSLAELSAKVKEKTVRAVLIEGVKAGVPELSWRRLMVDFKLKEYEMGHYGITLDDVTDAIETAKTLCPDDGTLARSQKVYMEACKLLQQGPKGSFVKAQEREHDFSLLMDQARLVFHGLRFIEYEESRRQRTENHW
eukprot:gene23740-9298_t